MSALCREATQSDRSARRSITSFFQDALHLRRRRCKDAPRGQECSPTWRSTEEEFEATRPSFDNPDFVDVVVHSYRHRYGLVEGDPAYDDTERRIAEQPTITVPTIVLDGEHDAVTPARPRETHEQHFPALVDYRLVNAGHDLPQEAPEEFAQAVLDLRR